MTPSIISPEKPDGVFRRVLIPLAFWLGVWQLAACFVERALGKNSDLLFPGPLRVGRALLELGRTGLFWGSAGMSLARIFAGFAVGAALGTALAVLSACLPWAGRICGPAVKVVRAAPVASFIVLIQLWAPTGRVPAVVAALMVLPVLWGGVGKGIAETSPLLLEAARAYRFSGRKTARLVYAPSVLPYFSSGCSTALGLAWKAGVAAEVLCQPKLAIGARLYGAKITLDTPALFAWTIALIALSFFVERALGTAFQWLGKRGKV